MFTFMFICCGAGGLSCCIPITAVAVAVAVAVAAAATKAAALNASGGGPPLGWLVPGVVGVGGYPLKKCKQKCFNFPLFLKHRHVLNTIWTYIFLYYNYMSHTIIQYLHYNAS